MNHDDHDVWPLISRPGTFWCRDCQVHFNEEEDDEGAVLP